MSEIFLDDADLMWRDGPSTVVAPINCVLPRRCIKSNQPEENRKTAKIYWMPYFVVFSPLVLNGMLLLLSLLLTMLDGRAVNWESPHMLGFVLNSALTVVFYGLLRRTLSIEFSLSEEMEEKHALHKWVAVFLCIFGLGLITFGSLVEDDFLWQFSISAGLPVFVACVLYSSLFLPLIRVKKVEGDWIWLKGLHPDFVASLPQRPPVLGFRAANHVGSTD